MVEEKKKLSPFDFVSDVTEHKKYLYCEDTTKEYNPYIINKALSFNVDCLFMVNEMNQFPDVPNKVQHDFYFYGLDKKRRYGRWTKKDSLPDDIEMVKELYSYSTDKAIAALNILTDKQLIELRQKHEKGGKK